MRTVDPAKWSKSGFESRSRWRLPRLGVSAGGLEGRVRSSFKDALREYVQESTLEGIKYASQVETIKPLRHVYIFVMLVLLVWGTCVLAYFAYDYQSRPPLQVQLLQSAPDSSVPFPAIALCSNSIVSKKQLAAYASYLEKESNNKTYSLAKIQMNLQKFAALVTLRTADVEMLNFMQFLYNIDPHFNITDLMFTLSPKCSSMLSHCSWRGRRLPCDQLFATRLTPLGFCCLFNGRYQPEDVNTPPKVLGLSGQNYGLSVAVYQNIDDYAVVRQPSTYGLGVLVFEGGEFPLLEGGAVRAFNVATNASFFFQLTAHAQYATDDLANYHSDRRGCHIKDPLGPRSSARSYSWCLAECRRKTIAAVCNCQPFWYRPLAGTRVCTPEHLACLNKHREKFIYYSPGVSEDESLAEERQDSLDCRGCRPDCARVLHSAKVFNPPYYYPQKLFTNGAPKDVSLANKSLLRFYYDSLGHHTYRVDLNFFWYEVIASTSCQSLFLVGATIISAAELVFHFTFRWAHHFIRRTRDHRAERAFH